MAVPNHLYRPHIEEACRKYPPVPPNVLEAVVWTESNFDPMAKSTSNALGLTQIIYKYHKRMVDEVSATMGYQPHENTLYVHEVSLQAGARLLAWLYKQDGSRSWTRAVRAYFTGSPDAPDDFVDGQGTTTEQHVAKFSVALAEVIAFRSAKEPTVPGMKKHVWPGLKNPVYLPDDLPVEIRLIHHPRFTNHTIHLNKDRSTWHDTGNPRTNAEAEWKWANDGRPGAGEGGYNGIFDDRKVIITQPFNEVVWAAGKTEGNNRSWAFEQAWGTGVDFERTLYIGAAVHGGLLAAMGLEVGSSLVQHNAWTGKDCPGQIRSRSLWPRVVQMTAVAGIRAREAAANVGDGVKPTTYPRPVPIPGLDKTDLSKGDTAPAIRTAEGIKFTFVYDLVRAVRDTPRLRFADINNTSPLNKVGPDVKAGTRFHVSWIFTAHDGREYYLTPFDTRILVADTERIDDSVKEGA